jgi:hypothetical protein
MFIVYCFIFIRIFQSLVRALTGVALVKSHRKDGENPSLDAYD